MRIISYKAMNVLMKTERRSIIIKRKVNAIVARNLRVHRAEKSESIARVARNVGVNAATLATWEQTGRLSLDGALKMADYYGITLDALCSMK